MEPHCSAPSADKPTWALCITVPLPSIPWSIDRFTAFRNKDFFQVLRVSPRCLALRHNPTTDASAAWEPESRAFKAESRKQPREERAAFRKQSSKEKREGVKRNTEKSKQEAKEGETIKPSKEQDDNERQEQS